jgi:hypothetical protein
MFSDVNVTFLSFLGAATALCLARVQVISRTQIEPQYWRHDFEFKQNKRLKKKELFV